MATRSTPKPEPAPTGPLVGQTIVITGDMQRWSREEIEDLIASLGGHTRNSVSKSTTLVIAGPGAGSKLVKALELNVKIINENQFAQMIGPHAGAAG